MKWSSFPSPKSQVLDCDWMKSLVIRFCNCSSDAGSDFNGRNDKKEGVPAMDSLLPSGRTAAVCTCKCSRSNRASFAALAAPPSACITSELVLRFPMLSAGSGFIYYDMQWWENRSIKNWFYRMSDCRKWLGSPHEIKSIACMLCEGKKIVGSIMHDGLHYFAFYTLGCGGWFCCKFLLLLCLLAVSVVRYAWTGVVVWTGGKCFQDCWCRCEALLIGGTYIVEVSCQGVDMSSAVGHGAKYCRKCGGSQIDHQKWVSGDCGSKAQLLLPNEQKQGLWHHDINAVQSILLVLHHKCLRQRHLHLHIFLTWQAHHQYQCVHGLRIYPCSL